MRKLKINLDELATAMEGIGGDGAQYYLDLRTSELHLVMDEVTRAVEDDETDDLPDWQQADIEIARRALEGDENLIEVARIESSESFRIMEDFVSQLPESAARKSLSNALTQPKPFRQFKDALLGFPKIREQWFDFENERKQAMARQWLVELEIEPTG